MKLSRQFNEYFSENKKAVTYYNHFKDPSIFIRRNIGRRECYARPENMYVYLFLQLEDRVFILPNLFTRGVI